MANLIFNGDFELDTPGTDPASNWGDFNSPGNIVRAVANDEAHTGSNSFKINTTDGNTADCGFNQTEFTRSGGSKITVTPNTSYYFSSYIRTALTAGQAHIHIKLFDAGYTNESGYDTPNVTGVSDWTLSDQVFTTTATQVICEIWVCFGAFGSTANGKAWFDDLFLGEVTTTSQTITGKATIEKLIPKNRIGIMTDGGLILRITDTQWTRLK